MLLKREIGPKIVANWSSRGRRLRASWERFLGHGLMASILQKIRLDLASIWSQRDPDFRRDFHHDRATIGPRSGVNRDARASSIACRLMGDKSPPIPRQNLLDHGSIAPRSRLDRAEIVEFFHDVPSSSDEASGEWTVRSRSSGLSFWWRSDAPRVATWHQVSAPIWSTYSPFVARAWYDVRVDSGPHDRRPAIRAGWIRRLSCRHAFCKVRAVWEHSPIRRK